VALNVTRISPESQAGLMRECVFSVDFDNSYTTGGKAIDFSGYYFHEIYSVQVSPKSGYLFSYDPVNKKIIVYRQTNPAAAGGADVPLVEVANAFDLSTVKDVRVTVKGN
jgi:hypothetical protein